MTCILGFCPVTTAHSQVHHTERNNPAREEENPAREEENPASERENFQSAWDLKNLIIS
jgi:hypothetical protein